MAGPDYPQDDQPGTTKNVPSLIHDYRAQREAWREQARNLARMREEVLSAADREAHDIVSVARAEIRRILLKARRDLLVLAAQVRAAGRLGDAEDTPDAVTFLPADDLGQARDVLTTARHDVRRVLDESRPELEGLAAEGEALRASLRQHRPIGPAPVEVRRQIAPPADQEEPDDRLEQPVPFEFTSLAAEDSPDLVLTRVRRPVRMFLVAAASIGALALMGTGLWLYRPQANTNTALTSVESGTASTSPLRDTSKRAATASAAVDSRTAGSRSNAGARSALPNPRSPLSVQLAARRSAWVRVTVDGRVTAERIFKPGETEQVNATREVSVRAGDAGAVTVSVDGRQPVALGPEGEVLTRRFAVEAPRVKPAAPARTAPVTPNPSVPVAQAPVERPSAPSVVAPPAAVASTSISPRAPSVSPRAPEQQPVASTSAPSLAAPPAVATAPARPPASIERPTAPPPAPAATQASLQESLTNVALRFLDAHYRQDRATMAAISAQVNVSDDRGEKERLPNGLTAVRRSFDDLNFRVFGSEAMLTARMTERMDNAAAGQMSVSFISHTWTQRNGLWQLYDVRIVSASALSRATTKR